MKRFFVTSLASLLAVLALSLFVVVPVFAQDPVPEEISAGDLVLALSTIVTYGISWVLRTFVFPKMSGLGFLSIVVLVVTPVLSYLVTLVAGMIGNPEHSYLQVVLFGLLSVVVRTVYAEWIKFTTKTPEGQLRGAK